LPRGGFRTEAGGRRSGEERRVADVYEIERAGPSDDGVLAEHYLGLWQGYGVPPGHLLPDARRRVLAFLGEARADLEFGGFVGRTEGMVVPPPVAVSAARPTPRSSCRSTARSATCGASSVDPRHRRRGLARRLTEACLAHLRAIGCQTVLLHSSEAGRPLYRTLGFAATSELRLVL
jgi:GNAT superfamily N-acetyltransferase